MTDSGMRAKQGDSLTKYFICGLCNCDETWREANCPRGPLPAAAASEPWFCPDCYRTHRSDEPCAPLVLRP